MSHRILIADDEPDILDMLEGSLRAGGFDLLKAFDGSSALLAIRRYLPAAVVLDYDMPGLSGVEVCRELKNDKRTGAIPVLMLSGRCTELDRVLAFELGADDYVTKPFSPREVTLRVKAILNRSNLGAPRSTLHAAGAVIIDLERHRVTVAGRGVELTAIEFKLLAALAQRCEQVLTREQLLATVWGSDSTAGLRAVDTHLRRLREKMGEAAHQISTVRGFGYRLTAA